MQQRFQFRHLLSAETIGPILLEESQSVVDVVSHQLTSHLSVANGLTALVHERAQQCGLIFWNADASAVHFQGILSCMLRRIISINMLVRHGDHILHSVIDPHRRHSS